MGRLDAIEVRRAYDKFDMLRLRSEPFDGSCCSMKRVTASIHKWMFCMSPSERPFGWPDDREAVDGSA